MCYRLFVYKSHTRIYIYIYILLSTDCLVVSQLFNDARRAQRFKLRSKPAQPYVRLSILSLSQLRTDVSSVIVRHYVLAFVCLHFVLPDTRVLSSLKEFCITWVAAINSFTRVLNPLGGDRIYIYIYMCIYIIIIIMCRAASTCIPDPLSTLLPIVHHLWQVIRSTSRILT